MGTVAQKHHRALPQAGSLGTLSTWCSFCRYHVLLYNKAGSATTYADLLDVHARLVIKRLPVPTLIYASRVLASVDPYCYW